MATEPKRYAQRGTKVGEKTKLKNLPTALRDEPSYGRSLSFRSDSPKTSTGGSGGSNLIPRSRVDMASGDRNIGSQGSSAKNTAPKGISGPGAGKSEAFIRGANDALYKGSMGATTQLASDLLNSPKIKQNRDEVTRRAIAKASKPKEYDIPKDFGMKNQSEDWEDKKSDTPKAPVAKAPTTKTGSSKTGSSKGESQTSKDARMAAYEDWVKTNRDPATASYLKTGHMKKGGKVKAKPMKAFAKGGSVKSSASSRGDGCATKGHTRGVMR